MLLMDSWFRFEMPEGYRSYCPMKQNLFLGVPPRLITSNMIKLLLFFHTFPWGGKRLFCRIAAKDVELCLEILNDSNIIVLQKKKMGVCYGSHLAHLVGGFIYKFSHGPCDSLWKFGEVSNVSRLRSVRRTVDPFIRKIMTGSSFTKQSASFSCVSQFQKEWQREWIYSV